MNTTDTLWQICTEFFFPRRLELRSDKTRKAYRLALNSYGKHLGHLPTIADLDDDLVAVWVGAQLDKAGSVYSVRERMGRVLSLWRFLASRGHVTRWPTIRRPAAPDPVPIALSQEELLALFESSMYEPGKIDGIRAGWWWQAYLSFIWNTAERRTAALSLKWDDCNLATGVAIIPASERKGGKKAGIYRLWPEVVSLIDRMKMPPRSHVFPWPYSEGRYYHNYGRILERAGLPNDRRRKTHCLRVSHNSWHKVMTGQHSPLLMHGSSATSERHYEDRRLTAAPAQKLFIPWTQPPPAA